MLQHDNVKAYAQGAEASATGMSCAFNRPDNCHTLDAGQTPTSGFGRMESSVLTSNKQLLAQLQ